MNCGGITIGAEYDCLSPLKAGINTRLLVGNLADIDVVTLNVTQTNVITNLTMKATKFMYAFYGVRSSVQPQMTGERVPSSVGYKHKINFSVFEVDTPQKVNLLGMALIKQFCIYQNPKDSSLGDAVWEVMGLGAGLRATVLTRMPGIGVAGGAYTIELSTKQNTREKDLPLSFFNTDISTTEALIDGLLEGELISPEAQLVLDRMV